ncbi:MAG: thioredoxin-dependent thiol peroxidase [Pseudobdellovibrionaceae bacterium]|uniref:thioredoxin-dependent thiol peroxidase n=1 Tax=Oligoflexus sp. TaxID=1971216 RepID=UPI0027D0BDF5|nr:thioredoxin-dependent thiol peroxidase [Oligoflexus sp.]MDQ3232235.1 thioredoxin-dependent thiol peroxidase [Pseudobdellovibrionaceae bacterium]HYX37970.1 thioredoxin-dependent thiol peroxidase [Oligoflexus sp.]
MSDFLEVGAKAPAFSLQNQDGETVSLKDFKGENIVVLYFYPKAMTPGCTTQACGLRDSKRKYTNKGIVVLGVSPDAPDKLDKFRVKEKLNFDLLSDPDHAVAESYGAWGLKKNYGKEYMGVIRSTFIIGKDSKIMHVMPKVNTKTHHDDVLEWIQANS